MPVTAFFAKVYIGLITEKDLMTTISNTYCRGINLITIAYAY